MRKTLYTIAIAFGLFALCWAYSLYESPGVSTTEFEYLDGVTSAIQTQINSKIGSAGVTYENLNSNSDVDTDLSDGATASTVPSAAAAKDYADSVAGAPTNVTPVDTGDENATFYPVLVDGATGSQATETDGELSYNPNTDTLTVKNIALASGGSISGIGAMAVNDTINGLTKSVSIGNCEGVHDGDANAATLADSGESLTVDAYIGMTVYNITDGSSCTVTDNDATTITCTLAGGTDNDWDVDDVWQVGPGPYQSGSVFYISAATTIAHPATAGYVAEYFVNGAVVVKIDPHSDSMTINFSDDGVYTDPGAGDEIDGSGAQGDFILIHNASTTEAFSHGVTGSWEDGGAS